MFIEPNPAKVFLAPLGAKSATSFRSWRSEDNLQITERYKHLAPQGRRPKFYPHGLGTTNLRWNVI
jgi:hypothetical protein